MVAVAWNRTTQGASTNMPSKTRKINSVLGRALYMGKYTDVYNNVACSGTGTVSKNAYPTELAFRKITELVQLFILNLCAVCKFLSLHTTDWPPTPYNQMRTFVNSLVLMYPCMHRRTDIVRNLAIALEKDSKSTEINCA